MLSVAIWPAPSQLSDVRIQTGLTALVLSDRRLRRIFWALGTYLHYVFRS